VEDISTSYKCWGCAKSAHLLLDAQILHNSEKR
jgi:hypothetical protein